ncbi:MAG: hypothetical protein IJS30_00760 [Bacteroidales bacterium]|nr:hypothetical protein [Bacteroidales bacterium]
MRKLPIIFFAALALLSVSCDKESQRQVEQLQNSLTQLEKEADGIGLPAAVTPGTETGTDYSFIFNSPKYGVDAGGNVVVEYSLPEPSTVDVSTNGGWSVRVNALSDTQGEIIIVAPDPASPCEIVATARTESGKSVAAVVPVMVRDPYSDATRTSANLLGYYNFKPQWATQDNFFKLADAGLTSVTVECGDYDFREQINRAWKAGMKSLAIIGFAGSGWASDPDHYTYLDNLVGYLKQQPGLLGYHICDEPNVDEIPRLRRIREKIESLDPDHPVYINLNPEGSKSSLGTDTYREYIEAFARDCGVKFISFDMYPILPDGTYMKRWHYCLRTVADVCHRYGIPFWAFAASCWIDKESGVIVRGRPSMENLRLQAYTDMAYGAQLVQFFTIQQYGGTSLSPILATGEWTEAYDYLKEACLQIQKRGYVFNGCNVEKIRFCREPAAESLNLAQKDLPEQIASLETNGAAMVSFLENRGNRYIAIVNQSYTSKISAQVTFNEMVYTIEQDGSFVERQSGSSEFTIDEGDLMVIKVK